MPRVDVLEGRVLPDGWYRMYPRDSYWAERDFYNTLVAFAIFFTVFRFALTRLVVMPLGRRLALKRTNFAKLEEAIMQVGFYSVSWGYNAHFLYHQEWFWNPILCFLDNFPRQTIEPEISFYYAMQTGWYLHGVYTHFFLDTKKSDFLLMLLHHAITLALLYAAYVGGYFRVGMLVMFSMDICDVFLYSAKILKIIKSGGKIDYPKAVYYIGFGMIPVTWLLFRLIYFPFVVMWTTSYDGMRLCGWEEATGWVFFNTLLVLLLVLNIWWGHIIAKIMWSSLTSKDLQKLDDIREKDARDEHNTHPTPHTDASGLVAQPVHKCKSKKAQ